MHGPHDLRRYVPAALTSLIFAHGGLERLLDEDQSGADRFWQFSTWCHLLFGLWMVGWVELWGRAGRIDAPLALIAAGIGERYWTEYDINELREHGRLRHVNGQIFNDLHLRLTPPVARPAPESSEGSPRKRRDAMVFTVWKRAGLPNWTAKEAFRETTGEFTSDTDRQILNVGKTTQSETLKRVREMHPGASRPVALPEPNPNRTRTPRLSAGQRI